MKIAKKIALLTIFFIFLASFIFPQESSNLPTGIDLCNSVYSFFKSNDFQPQIQPLISTSGENEQDLYPYNILLDFNGNLDSKDKLILIFFAEDTLKFRPFILQVCKELQKQDIKSTVIISYGENQTLFLKDKNYIFGHEVFLKSLNTNENNIVYIFNLSSKNNLITAGSRGYPSPSWMIKNAYSSFNKNRLVENLPFYMISQPLNLPFYDDNILGNFLENNISAIKINFKTNFQTSEKDIQKYQNIIFDIIQGYKTAPTTEKDNHSMMFRFFNKTIWFSEFTIVRIIILNILASLIFILTISFLNRNLKNKAWKEIKNNWYTLPATYLFSVGGFFLGQFLYLQFFPNHTECNPFESIFLQLVITTIILTIFYSIELFFHKNYGEKSLDYLILISNFINQFLFSLMDISLFPIFMLICICSIFSLIIKKNWFHILLFFIIIFSLLPYINRLYETTDYEKLHFFISHSFGLNLILPLIITPILILVFRIFIALRKHVSSKAIFSLIITITFLIFFTFIFELNEYTFTHHKENGFSKLYNEKSINLIESEQNDNFINITYSDKKIFNDVIRTVQIHSKEKPEFLEFSVTNLYGKSVLYSNNDYIEIPDSPENRVIFPIPSHPEKDLTFTYAAGKSKRKIVSTLSVEAVYKYNPDDNQSSDILTTNTSDEQNTQTTYILRKHSIETGTK
ncbi:MAG: hypothetical protein MJ188_02145 [Treponema sp.]|nr:hypothetical protein [Treponema sp.]